jgi:hypothetical protein
MSFNIGDRVRSRVNAQGLILDAPYQVTDVATFSNFTGRYTSYTLRADNGAELTVGNGDHILDLVSTPTI